jgi:CheY-like chemotaxis protein
MNRIRQMPAFSALPIIAVTARAMPGDKEKSIAAGASDYVTKPVDTDELLACMERWLARRLRPAAVRLWSAAARRLRRRSRCLSSGVSWRSAARIRSVTGAADPGESAGLAM